MINNKLLILMPVYNDYESANKLIAKINQVLLKARKKATILVIDDGSQNIDVSLKSDQYKSIEKINIVYLKRNLGHQGAIAVGLSYVSQHFSSFNTIVMDSDGEDRPEDIIKFLDANKNNQNSIIFAKRIKRTESLYFKIFYQIYKLFFRLLTDKKIFFGNFSLIPASLIGKVVMTPDIWWHYAASILNSKLKIISIPTTRGYRLCGKSKMNFYSLVLHGLRAFAVFSEKIALRLLLSSLSLGILIVLTLLVIVYIRLFTSLAIPGWTSTLFVLLSIVFLQVLLISFISFFTILNTKNISSMSIVDQLKDFVKEVGMC